jgi:hypothetical protein
VFLQLFIFANFNLPSLLAFLKAKFSFPFFVVRKFEAFERALQQSSSRLIKGFLSLFSFFKLL